MRINSILIKRLFLLTLLTAFISNSTSAMQDSVKATLDSTQSVNSSALKVTGTIKDASTGKPLDGISISVPGFSASITNADGTFTVSVPDYQTYLVISGNGFNTKEIALKGRSSVSAVLYEDTFTSQYDAVVLPNITKLANSTVGAVKSLNVSDNWQRISESPDTYLQGRIPGVNAIRRSGTQGIGASVFLRGYSSLFTTNQPLYVVDGIYYDNNDYSGSLIAGHVENPLANIDLKDIDNITVIKDATASIYGTKAANGVILITTARAKEQATKIDFAAYGGFNSANSNIPVLNGQNYRSYISDALGDRYLRLGYSPAQAQTTVQQMPFMQNSPSYGYNTNWQNEVLRNSYNQTYYMKVTGGDNIATYGLSVGYLKNEGITDLTDLTRYQTRFNADLNLSTKFKGFANLSFVSNQQNLRDQGAAKNTNPIYLALTKAPILSPNVTAENGQLSPVLSGIDAFRMSNPAVAVNDMQGVNRTYRFVGSLGFNYVLNKEFQLQNVTGVTFSKVRENIFIPNNGIVPDTLSRAIARNQSGTNVERLYSLFNDLRLSYAKTFTNVHALSANLGFRIGDNKSESDYGLGYNSATDDYVTVGNGQASLREISGSNGTWRNLNTYLNTDYSFRHKYFLSFNMALDASSRFGRNIPNVPDLSGNKLAVMPSLAAGWLVSSESFMAKYTFIDVLKLRASFGSVGNDDIGNYNARQYYLSENLFGLQGLVRGNIANTGLKWETIEKLNLGLDLSVLRERLNISVDAFRNNTYDMLIQEEVSPLTGFDYAYTNNGGMKTTGVELGLSSRILNKRVKWDMGLNISRFKTEITKLPGDRLLTNYAGATILTQKGMGGNLFYGYKTNGVYATNAEAAGVNRPSLRTDGTVVPFSGGDVRFVNTDGDDFIDEDDRQVIGDPTPDFTGMLSNMVSWKRFSFDAMLTFSVGNDVYNYTRRNLESMNGFENQTPYVLNRWRYQGQVTDVPRASLGDPAENARFSDRWIEDGSYLRLRTLSITYDVPMKNKALKYTKVYVSGNNVFTLSRYLGYDPEFSATGSVFTQGIDVGLEPQFRTLQLGVRIGL
ncbi:MAG: SusC/RagA family TonB-linked outer membrane protein [Sphingobacteriaceae bacterium]|nr:SusC/RagA family TonB-linked outer membrane protein [Sphingobacteriaceae bacterium]